jgi:ABC-type dipeptide/oligopeptide/nickel transport system permease subunit
MFKVYVWLIDSSDNWRMIYKSYPPYTTVTQERRIDLNWYDVLAGWQGMVPESGETEQEDPTDNLTVAFGLAPTFQFSSYGGIEPWRIYSGSVTVDFSYVSLFAYGGYFGLLGTTDKGADAWSQLVYGSRVSLTIGILATALSTVVGVVVGMVAGYFGGKVDEVLMRMVDFLLVIPRLPLMMVLAAFLGPTINNIIVVIAILGWTGTSRLIRSQVMAEKNKAYVESARAIGASDTYIIFRHILPNVTPILFADITLGVVGAILAESGLAFLGLTSPSEPSWGRMLADAQGAGGFTKGAWWVVMFPGLMITTISLAFTLVGHTLDQVLNPRLRER